MPVSSREDEARKVKVEDSNTTIRQPLSVVRPYYRPIEPYQQSQPPPYPASLASPTILQSEFTQTTSDVHNDPARQNSTKDSANVEDDPETVDNLDHPLSVADRIRENVRLHNEFMNNSRDVNGRSAINHFSGTAINNHITHSRSNSRERSATTSTSKVMTMNCNNATHVHRTNNSQLLLISRECLDNLLADARVGFASEAQTSAAVNTDEDKRKWRGRLGRMFRRRKGVRGRNQSESGSGSENESEWEDEESGSNFSPDADPISLYAMLAGEEEKDNARMRHVKDTIRVRTMTGGKRDLRNLSNEDMAEEQDGDR